MGMKYMHFAYISKDFLGFYVAAANPSAYFEIDFWLK